MRLVILALRLLGGLVASLCAGLATMLLPGCSDPADFERQGSRWTYLGEPLEGADAARLRVLDAHHAADGQAVWWCDTERRGQEYYMVRHALVQRIEGADAPSFAVLKEGYSRDRIAVYFQGLRMDLADAASFEAHAYGFARDARHVYYDGRRVGDDPAGFVTLERGYARTNKTVYHLGTPVAGADVASFEVLGSDADAAGVQDGADARDARRRYARGQRLVPTPAAAKAR